MDMTLVVAVAVAVIAVLALLVIGYNKIKEKVVPTLETAAEKTGLEFFVALQHEMQSRQQNIDASKASLIQAQAQFRAAQAAVAALTVPAVS